MLSSGSIIWGNYIFGDDLLWIYADELSVRKESELGSDYLMDNFTTYPAISPSGAKVDIVIIGTSSSFFSGGKHSISLEQCDIQSSDGKFPPFSESMCGNPL